MSISNTTPSQSPHNKRSFKQRIMSVKPSRWVRFGIVSAVFFFWVILMGNPWLLFIWPLLIDIYITQYIPWGWWKHTKGATRAVMAWVDAIIYALVLIYFIFAFVGQQYEIPSSSLEKSLLVGDRLWVDKTVYGSRVPQTPLHFPLADHTIPGLNIKSYIEKPQLAYHRMPGIRSIERGDIVVFNYPCGDTVCRKITNPDFYQICNELKKGGIADPIAYINSYPDKFGKIDWRPVDRRDAYVKRSIGLPGERLKIINDTIFINGKPIAEPANVQYNYVIATSAPIDNNRWMELGIRLEDLQGYPSLDELSNLYVYDLPLTADMKAKVEKFPELARPLMRESDLNNSITGDVFPLGANYNWQHNNMGEIWIPKRGYTLHLTDDNYPIYERAIRTYEGNNLEKRDGKIFINGVQTDYYTFKMDYYWMMGDNRDRSADSRYWGFVPEDHVIGQPAFIILSLDKDRSISDGKIRWNRILSNPNPDKKSGKW